MMILAGFKCVVLWLFSTEIEWSPMTHVWLRVEKKNIYFGVSGVRFPWIHMHTIFIIYVYIYIILYTIYMYDIISTYINSPGNIWERSWQTMVFASLMSSTRCLLAGQLWGANRDHDWHASYTDEPGLLQIQTNPSTSTTSSDHPPVPMTNMLYRRVTFREMTVTCTMCVIPKSFHQGWPILDGRRVSSSHFKADKKDPAVKLL